MYFHKICFNVYLGVWFWYKTLCQVNKKIKIEHVSIKTTNGTFIAILN